MQIEIPSKNLFKSISEFRFLHQLGVGSFGKVKLVIHKGTRKKYAIKIIDLTANLKETEFLIIERQLKVHSQMDHPHIIKLWDILRDQSNIYMVMEYASNGSLFKYHSKQLIHGSHPSLSQVYQFFFQTLQAIHYLHYHDIMHRDIKPENLLLDQDLNIKICDFGWATSQITTLRTTFCGTYEYMAPQMVLEKTYNYKIDIWALGILLYELIHGKAPFQAENLTEMKQKIKKGSYQIDNSCSQYLRNLITQILQFSPEKRLSLAQIQSHPWIKITQNLSQQREPEKKKHQYQKSMDNFLSPLKNQLQMEKTLKMKNHLFPAKKMSKNDKKISIQKTNHLVNSLQTESNSNLEYNPPSIKKMKKKCKTQGQDELIQLEKQIINFSKTVITQGFDTVETKRKKVKQNKENVNCKIADFRQKNKNRKEERFSKLKNERYGQLSSKFFKQKLGLVRKNQARNQ